MNAPIDAEYMEPITKSFYKKIGNQWYIWSRIENEQLHWCKACGINPSCLFKI